MKTPLQYIILQYQFASCETKIASRLFLPRGILASEISAACLRLRFVHQPENDNYLGVVDVTYRFPKNDNYLGFSHLIHHDP